MNDIVNQCAQYFLLVADGVMAARLFASFSAIKQKWKTLSFAGFIFLFRLLLDFTPLNNTYLLSGLIILTVFGASFLFRVSMPMRVFLTCCFWSVKEICRFTALGPRSAINNAISGIVMRGLENQTLTAPESIERLFNISVVASAVANAVTYTVLIFLILRYITKNFIYKNYMLRRTEILFLILPCLSGVAVMQILRSVFFLPGETVAAVLNTPSLTVLFIPMTGVVLLLGIAASVKLYQSLIRLHIEETDKKIMAKQITQIREQVQDVQTVYADIRGIRHDMANHLSNIRLLIQAGTDNTEELNGYIRKLEDTLDTLRFDYQTGNPITDVIIHQRMLEARSNGVDFESDFLFPDTLEIDSFDIAVILSNALDNALEACEVMPEDKRFIKLSTYRKGVMFFIEVENSYSGNLTFDETTGLPVSGKADNGQHGIGLTNIKRCAGKHFGDINITHHGGVFRLTVMLQGKA